MPTTDKKLNYRCLSRRHLHQLHLGEEVLFVGIVESVYLKIFSVVGFDNFLTARVLDENRAQISYFGLQSLGDDPHGFTEPTYRYADEGAQQQHHKGHLIVFVEHRAQSTHHDQAVFKKV